MIALADERARAAAAAYDATAALAASSVLARNATTLARLFLGIFNRAPDEAGLRFWYASMSTGARDVEVAQAMLTSPEGAARFPAGMSDRTMLTRIFEDMLGHAPTQADYDKYLPMIGASSRAAMVAALVNDVASGRGGNLVQMAARELFNSKVSAALKLVVPAMSLNLQVLSSALTTAQTIVTKNPENRHVNRISKGIDSTLQGGAADARDIRWNGIDLLKLDRWGNTISVADLRNPTWTTEYKYNVNNQMVMVMQPWTTDGITGNAVRPTLAYGYDALGRMVSSTDANGNVSRTEYNGNGNIATEIHADGGKVINTYDAFGNRLTSARTRGFSYPDIVTTYTYDKLSQLTSSSTASVDVFHAVDQQDGGGMDARSTGTRVLTERYEYDQAGRRTKSTNAANQSTRMEYDQAGNVIRIIDPLLRPTLMSYDSFGHKLSETNALGATMRWDIGSLGQLKSHTDLSGTTISYVYNGLNQIISQTSTLRVGVNPGLKAGKQEIVYSYENGKLTRIEDSATGTTTTYAYDPAGNRVMEKTVVKVDGVQPTVIQNNRISYDQLGRMSRVTDSRFDVKFSYDRNGNRTLVDTSYLNGSGTTTTNVKAYNKFDSMNRVTIANGDLAGGNIVYGTNGHAISYDQAGNRLSDTYRYKDKYGNLASTTENFTYDAAGRLCYVLRDGITVDYRVYDAASRVIREGALYASQADKLKEFGIGLDTRTYAYDAAGQVQRLKYRTLSGEFLDDVYYRTIPEHAGGYDAAGRLTGYSVVPRDRKTHSYYDSSYIGFDSYKESTVIGRNNSPPKTTTIEYDVNGNVIKVTDSGAPDLTRRYINDANGHVLQKTQNGKTTYSLVANGEVLGDSGAESSGIGFANTYESASSAANTAAPSIYTAQGGETLQGIAKAVWGDSRLWYLIADANGKTGRETLVAGEIIKLPSRTNTVHSDNTTFKPYNVSEAIGDTRPVLPVPTGGNGGGCGAIGTIIKIVVAVIVTFYATAAAAKLFGATGGFSLNAVAAGAVGAAAGSIASQGVGIAMGMQDKINWQGVRLAALGGGVSAGVAGQFNSTLGPATSSAALAVRAGVANMMSQGLAVATGLQEKFEWRNVAAAAAGAAVGGKVSDSLAKSKSFQFLGKFGEPLARGTISGFAAGLTAQVVSKGRIDIARVAADAFGNAIGSSLAAMSSGSGTQRQTMGLTFADDSEARVAANPILSFMDKQNRATEAAEILEAQARESGMSPTSAVAFGATSAARLPFSLERSALNGGSYDYQTSAFLSDGMQSTTRVTHRGVDDYLGGWQEGVSRFVSETDDIASAAGASRGFQMYAAATYGLRKMAGDTGACQTI
jgi:YD repeat-containing protein